VWGKRKIVTQQILPILTYECEVYPFPSEQHRRIAAEIQRWVVGAYRGSNANKVEQLTGIAEIGRLMQNRRVRWVASVYGRHLPELREVAESILREWVEADSELRWMEGCPKNRSVRVEDLEVDRVEEWSDGSRMEGRVAGATRTEAMYLGAMATTADAEALGVSLAWQTCDKVALDSQGVIQRIYGLTTQAPRSWIEERLARQMAERPRVLIWVKGHSGVVGNGEADVRAKSEVCMGERMHWPDIVTPAGIGQAFPLHDKAPRHQKWNRMALPGLTYLVTDKGPQRQWLKEIEKVDDPSCVCDGWTPQNAAHLFVCHGWETVLGDRGNRRMEMKSGVRRWRGLWRERLGRIRR